MRQRISFILVTAIFWLNATSLLAQPLPNATSVNYFSPPLDIPMYLSGNFAELRRNHFHSGIDIKTQGVEGKRILAAAEGFVSRIRISPYGYGKALYIDHPNGYTTVYGHLQRLSPRLEEIAQAAQREQRSYEIDLEIPDFAVPVKRSEFIAYSGNTGGSGGPHLHFEIRVTETEIAINPLLFKFPVQDNIKPTVRGLRVYPMNDSSYVSNRPEDRSYVVSGGSGSYSLKNNETVQVYGEIAFGVHTYDLLNGYSNKCGVHNIKLFHNGELIFESQLDSLNFSTFRQINTYKDYRLFHENSWHYHRSYRAPNNRLAVYRTVVNNGVIRFADDQMHNMKYEIRDVYGNLSTLDFKVHATAKPKHIEPRILPEPDAVFKYDQDNIFVNDEVILTMPPYRLYEDLNFVYGWEDTLTGCLTPVHHIHNDMVPVDKFYNLRIKVADVPEGLEDKVLVTMVNSNNHHRAKGGRYRDGWISVRLREFGNFTVRLDTTPPSIRPINVFNGKSMAGSSRIDFKISDNLSGIKHFEAEIDGKWILMEYEYKNARITHYLEPGAFAPGDRKLVLRVTDERNNVATYEAMLKF